MTLARRALVILALVALALMAGLAVATQSVAAACHYPRVFGGGVANVGPVRIYAPWAFADWRLRYAGEGPKAFDAAALWGLLAALPPLVLALIAGASRSRTRRSSPRPIVKDTAMPSQAAPPVRQDWRNVLPAGAPGCSQGTPYSFWVR
jgi:hypothetical protein